MKTNCHWCSCPSESPIPIKVTDDPYDDLSYACSPACEKNLKSYFQMCRRNLKWALLGYVLLVPVTMLFIFYIKVPYFGELFAAFVGLSGGGLLPIFFPIFTQNTIESLGVLNAKSFVRFTATALVLMGPVFLFLTKDYPVIAITFSWACLPAIIVYWIVLHGRVKNQADCSKGI
jgi:hypothetical protein